MQACPIFLVVTILISDSTLCKSGKNTMKCGRLIREGKKAKPDTRKGCLYAETDEDGLMHVRWTELGHEASNECELDLVVFAGDAELRLTGRGGGSTGRVLVLSLQDAKKKEYFWIQDADINSSDERATKAVDDFNTLLNEVSMDDFDDKDEGDVFDPSLTQNQPVTPAARPAASAHSALTTDFLSSLLKNMGKGGGAGASTMQMKHLELDDVIMTDKVSSRH